MNENEMMAATLLAHLGYGAATGSLYAVLDPTIPLDSRLKGALAGLIVWMASYLGWLPALGLLTPATRHPRHRNLLMITAHFIWGLALGESVRRLTAQRWSEDVERS